MVRTGAQSLLHLFPDAKRAAIGPTLFFLIVETANSLTLLFPIVEKPSEVESAKTHTERNCPTAECLSSGKRESGPVIV
jgi:hypothetical protein